MYLLNLDFVVSNCICMYIAYVRFIALVLHLFFLVLSHLNSMLKFNLFLFENHHHPFVLLLLLIMFNPFDCFRGTKILFKSPCIILAKLCMDLLFWANCKIFINIISDTDSTSNDRLYHDTKNHRYKDWTGHKHNPPTLTSTPEQKPHYFTNNAHQTNVGW